MDIVLVWVYCIICVFVVDAIKVSLFKYFNENTEVLPDEIETSVSEKVGKHGHDDHEAGNVGVEPVKERKSAEAVNRLSEWAETQRMSIADPVLRESLSPAHRASSTRKSHVDALNRDSFISTGKIHVNHNLAAGELRPSLVSAGAIRPNVPANSNVKLRNK